MTEFARRSARVVVINAADQVLLIKSMLSSVEPERGYGWFTPGGGVEPGEDLPAAAIRELREETGLLVTAADLTAVAYSGGYADLGWRAGVFRDDYFSCRIDSHEVDLSGLTELEKRIYGGHRWWTHGDLAATTETIIPPALAGLFADLLAGWSPARPVELPWHH